jgi:hypothetical protein
MLAMVLVGCGDGDDAPVYEAGDTTIRAEAGEHFVLELVDDPDDAKRWYIATDDVGHFEDLGRRIEALPGVKQVEYPTDIPTARFEGGTAFEVFTTVDATPEQTEAIEAMLVDDPAITADDIDHISQAEQYELFLDYFADHPENTARVSPDELPASMRVAPTVDRILRIGERTTKDDRLRVDVEALSAGDVTITAAYYVERGTSKIDDAKLESFEVTVG